MMRADWRGRLDLLHRGPPHGNSDLEDLVEEKDEHESGDDEQHDVHDVVLLIERDVVGVTVKDPIRAPFAGVDRGVVVVVVIVNNNSVALCMEVEFGRGID